MANIVLHDGLTTIKNSAFSSSSATYEKLSIPATVMEIGSYAFCYNNNLKELILNADDSEEATDGKGKTFGKYAFGNKNTLTVTSHNNIPPTILDDTFSNETYNNGKLIVGKDYAADYKAANGWKKFQNIEGSTQTGIDNIGSDNANEPAEYFNLQGVRVDNPENGIFIRRQGNKTSKVIL